MKPSPALAIHSFKWTALFWLVLTGSSAAQEPGSGPTIQAGQSWGRIVLVGASVSAGFTAAEPLGGSNTTFLRLSRYLDAALVAPHEPVRNLASALFFMKPEGHGRRQIQRALETDPSVIIGIDFLFWFCYGDGATDEERAARLITGLELLELVQCPLILGDIPDASAAVPRMLRPDQMPSESAMTRANQTIKEWVTSRPHVAILPLGDILRACVGNQQLNVGNLVLPQGQTRGLLQDDLLHPSPPGCAVIAVAILDTLHAIRPLQPAMGFRSNPKEVFGRVYQPAPSVSPAPTPLAD